MKDTKQNANNNTNTTVIQVNGDYYSGITETGKRNSTSLEKRTGIMYL